MHKFVQVNILYMHCMIL